MNNVKRKRNMLTAIAVIAMLALCFGMLVACNKTVENQGTGTFNIVFDYNDGSDTTVTQSFRFEEIQLYQPPTREGYTFLSWTLDREGEQQLTVETLQNGMTLYAQWSIKTYTVRFNDADGNLMSSQKVGYGKAAVAPSQEEIASHVQEGYAFVGWNKAFDNIKSDLTVTMLVEESISTYKVDFVYGDKVIASFVGEEGDRIPQNVNAPKKDGFTFANWKTQNGDVFDSASKFVANTTYYANFVITAPTAPTIVAQNSVVYGNSIALSVENEEEFEGLTYKYEWLLNDAVIGEGKNFTITDKLTVNNYNVKVRVSASCEGYDAKQTTSQPKAIAVEKATLTATLQPMTLTYGDEVPAKTAYVLVYSGFKFDDDESVLNTSNVSFETTYVKGANVGSSYVATASGIDADNYTVNFVFAVITVAKKTINVNAQSFETVYNPDVEKVEKSATLGSDKVSGLLNNHTITLTFSAKGKNVGEYTGDTLTASYSVSNGEINVTNNYDVVIAQGSKIDVLPANIVYSLPENNTFTYDALGHGNGITVESKGIQITYTFGENVSATAPTFTNAGEYTVHAVMENPNYNTAKVDYNVVINRASVKVIAKPQNTVYGDDFALARDYEIQKDFSANITIDGLTLTTAYESGMNVGNYDITVVITGENDNFDITTEKATLTVAQRTLNVTIADASVVYGNDFTPTLSLATVEGLIEGDDAGLTLGTSYVKSNATAGKDETIFCAITNENYALNANEATLSVEKRALTIAIGNASIAYGSAFDEISHGITSGTLANGDVYVATKDCNYAVGDDVDSYILNAVIAIANGNTDKTDNYDITVEQGTLTVNALEISVAIDGNTDKSITYGDALPEITASYTGDKYALDDIVVSTICNYVAGNNIGNYDIMLGVEITRDGNDKSNNYVVNYGTGTLTVNKRAVTVKLDGKSTTYGENAPELTYTVEGTFASTDNAVIMPTTNYVKGMSVKPYQISATTSITSKNSDEDKSANYDITVIDNSLTIGKRNITITANNGNIKYGETFEPSYEKIGEFAEDDEIAVNLDCAYTQGSNAGKYAISASVSITRNGEDYSNNYALTVNSAELTVAKRNITVKALGATIHYGDDFAIAYENNLEDLADIDQIDVFTSCAYLTAKAAGTYQLNPSVKITRKIGGIAQNDNYVIDITTATLVVDKLALSLTLNDATITYGDAFEPQYTLTGDVANGENANVTVNCAYLTEKSAGSFDILANVKVFNGTTETTANYDIATIESKTLTVNKKALNVSIANASVVYGNDFTPALSLATVEGLIEGDDAGLTLGTSYIKANATAGKDETITCAISNENYQLNANTATLIVEKRALTITLNSANVIYGNALPTLTYSADGELADFDEITVTPECEYVAGTGAGVYENYISASIAINRKDTDANVKANYNVSINNGALTVGKRTATVEHNMHKTQKNDGEYAQFDIAPFVNNAFASDVFAGALRSASAENGTYNVVGESIVWASALSIVDKDGNDAIENYIVEYKVEIVIDNALIGYTKTNYSGIYDAQPHTGSVNVKDIENYTIKYSVDNVNFVDELPSFTNVGNYTVYFEITTEELTPTNGSFTVSIDKKAITLGIERTVDYYDAFAPSTDMLSVDSYVIDDLGLSVVCEYAQGKNIGNYAITYAYANEDKIANYAIILGSNVLHVAAKEVTVTYETAHTINYGDAFVLPTFTTDFELANEYISLATTYAQGANAGNYPITVNCASSNYTLIATEGNITVKPIAIGINVANGTTTYGDAFTPSYAQTGNVASIDEIVVTLACGYEAGSNVGTYPITASVAITRKDTGDSTLEGNYNVTINNGTLTVNKREIVVSLNDGKEVNLARRARATDTNAFSVMYGEAFNLTQSLAGNFASADNGAITIEHGYSVGSPYGNYDITAFVKILRGEEDMSANYVVKTTDNKVLNGTAQVVGSLTVAKRDITFTVNSNVNGTFYYGDTLAPSYTQSGSGIASVDDSDISIVCGYLTSPKFGEFEITVSVRIQRDGTDVKANYNVVINTSSITVKKRPVTVTLAEQTVVYGDDFTVPTYDVDYEPARKDITITTTYNKTTAVGSYDFTTNCSNDNYDVTWNVGKLTVNKKDVHVSVANTVVTYGDALNATFTCDVENARQYIVLNHNYKQGDGVGDKNYAFSLACGNVNYNLIATLGTLTVVQRNVTISANNITATYGDTIPTATFNVVGEYSGAPIDRTLISVSYGDAVNAGTYTVAISTSALEAEYPNYTFTAQNGTLTVNKAKLTATITLASNSIVYGDAMPTIKSIAYTGFVNDETESVLNGTAVLSGYEIGAANGGVGTHTITVSGISADNYDIAFNTVNLEVTKKSLTVLARVNGGTTIVYGAAIPSITFVGFKEGLVAGDNFDASSITFAFDNYNTTKHTAGANKALKATCAAAVNYTFGTSVLDADTLEAITLTVNKAPLTITINQPSAIVYGGAVPNFTCTVDGLVDNGFINDSALANSVAISTTYTQVSNVGSYRVYADVSALESIFTNYTVTAANECTLTVNKANYTAEEIANIKHRTLEIMYAPENTLALLTLDSNFTWKDATQNIGDAGTHTFTAIYGGDSNHNPCEVSITVVVTKSNKVEITHNNNTEVQYGDDLSLTSIYNAQSTNTQNNAVTYNITTSGHVLNNATTLTDGGVYTIVMKSAGTSNYLSVSKTVTLKVKFAKIGSTYYTVEDALGIGGTITLDGNAFISSNVEVKSGTTLILPSSAVTSTTIGSPTYGAGQKAYVDTNKTYIEHVLTVDKGVTVTVNGTILVNGLLGAEGGILEGHTSGAHSQIVNNGTMTFNSGAKLDMRGYLKGNGTANFNNGSVVYSPFVVKDFRGGTNTVTVFRKGGIAPFSQYDMLNIQCEQYYYYGSKVNAYFDLYASKSHNTTQNIVIGTGGVIQLGKDGDFVKKSYNASTKKTTLTLVGTISLNSLSLKVQGVTVKMSDVLFPIPWTYDICLGNGTTVTTLALSYKYKLMTGASLTIEKNATLTLNSGAQAIVYSQFTDTKFGGAIYPTKGAAKFTVNGTLIVKNGATFGGAINSTANGAIVTFESGSTLSLSSKEGNSGDTSSLQAIIGTGTFVTVATITEAARLVGSTTDVSANTTYTYNGSTWA